MYYCKLAGRECGYASASGCMLNNSCTLTQAIFKVN